MRNIEFKDAAIEHDFEDIDPALRVFLEDIGKFRRDQCDGAPIVLTSISRAFDFKKPSYHAEASPNGWRAADIRTHDMDESVRLKILRRMNAIASASNRTLAGVKIEVIPHSELLGTPQAHIHIELDDDRFKKKPEPPPIAAVNNDHEHDGA